ncbi:hypothetical protein [Microseira wollei]|uniref:Transposase n=1 Tax=Microseira wollei NIES-4236 TaxID=2530354 RepID=A0AAV3X117_9CYAN|nr:hypothetical protein [Microseira wollei]GET35465.1 hypothetical protein MiSe_02070 [Microseira wollei NIES-4236]
MLFTEQQVSKFTENKSEAIAKKKPDNRGNLLMTGCVLSRYLWVEVPMRVLP